MDLDLGARQERLATLNLLGEILNREPEFERAVQLVLERLTELMGLSTGWVFLNNTKEGDRHQGSFTMVASTGLPPALAARECRPLVEGSCECQGLFRKGRLERGVNMVTCSRLASARGDRGGLRMHASVPLLGSHGPVGIINLAAPGNTRFDDETLTFLAAVGKQLGIAFERSSLLAQQAREARYTAVLEERARLAREMHDSLAQLLFAAELSLESAIEQGPGEASFSSTERAADAVKAALGELHGLIEVQRPADLSAGLPAALARLARRTGGGGTNVHLDTQPIELPEVVGEALYRIAQEALGNALRHSGARNVWIRLRSVARKLVMEIEDDGGGMSNGDSGGGLGMEGMRDRARRIGGRLELASDASGTRVRVEAPWPAG